MSGQQGCNRERGFDVMANPRGMADSQNRVAAKVHQHHGANNLRQSCDRSKAIFGGVLFGIHRSPAANLRFALGLSSMGLGLRIHL